MWAFLLAGCSTTVGGTPADGIAACGTPRPSDAALFAALTTNTWAESCGGGGGLAPTCNTVSLGADGHYEWMAVSDYVERHQHGDWNFYARTENAGIVCLDTGAVLPFMFDGNTLHFGRLALDRGVASAASGTRDGLATVVSDPIYAQMSAHSWTKTSSFDLFMDAQDFTLARDGTYNASYRDGECTHGGLWGIDLDPRSTGPTPTLLDQADANTCDTRGMGPANLPSVDVPRVDSAGRLIMYSSSYRPPSGDPRPWLSFDGYSDSVATSGYLDRDLAASAPTTLDLDIENRSMSAKTLASLTARLRSGTSVVDLASADLTGVALAPGDHHAVSLAVSPSAAGDAYFELELDYSDTTQPYASKVDYRVTVGP
jgi:hypothetical protein